MKNEISRKELLRRLGLMTVGSTLSRVAYASVPLLAAQVGCSKPKLNPLIYKEEPEDSDYQLLVNGKQKVLHTCRVSAYPINQSWPGYQRPVEQTELAKFATWDAEAESQVKLLVAHEIKDVVVRPLHAGIKPTVKGRQIEFNVSRPMNLVVEINGYHNAIHLFVNPKVNVSAANRSSYTYYYATGEHTIGMKTLRSNETVFIEEGAVVYGCFYASNSQNIKISGRGILDVSKLERDQGCGAIRMERCSNCDVSGIVLRDPDQWCLSIFACSDMRIDRVKLVGLWRYNADGIDICNSQRVTVTNCFVRSFDDSLVVKGVSRLKDLNVEDIHFENCVIWCDWGKAFEIGMETVTSKIERVTFKDCDIIRTSTAAMTISHGDSASIKDITFENIRIEMDAVHYQPLLQTKLNEKYEDLGKGNYTPLVFAARIERTGYSQADVLGNIDGVKLIGISVVRPSGKGMPQSVLNGANAEANIRNVQMRQWSLNGVVVNDLAATNITHNQFAAAPQYSL